MIRLLSILLLVPVCLFGAGNYRHEWVVYRYVHSDDDSVIGVKIACVTCGAGMSDPVANIVNGWCTCHTPQKSVRVISKHLCYTYPDDPADELPFSQGVNPRLADMSPPELAAIDWDNTADNISPDVQMLSYYPNGDVVTLPDGTRGVATDNADGDRVVVPFVNGTASGYQNGAAGTYALGAVGDGIYTASFTPAWNGGVSDSSPASSSVNNGGSSVTVVPVGSSSGGSTSAGSTVFDQPQTENKTNNDGDTYKVVSVPSQTVQLSNGSSVTLHDYSSILNAIGSNVSSGFDKLHDDNNTINENLRKQLETDNAPDVAADNAPEVDTSSVETEVDQIMGEIEREGSGWDFSFGMGSNPVGQAITAMIGNPPTSFGSQDNVCSINFSLPLVGTVQYSFKLSDWFPSAFRSCVLFILSIIFAIASAKAVAGAFR